MFHAKKAGGYAPMVVPAECMTYSKPQVAISRWTSAIWSETEGDEVPICAVSGSFKQHGVYV